MWVLTRNDIEVLKADGEWSYSHWGDPDEWHVFDSHKIAVEHAERLGVGDFTKRIHLEAIFQRRHEVEAKTRRRQKKRLKQCEYVALPEPIELHADEDAEVPFLDFMVTHYVVSQGPIEGVLGYGIDGRSTGPFWSFVGDEYDYVFSEAYCRTRPAADQENSVEVAQ